MQFEELARIYMSSADALVACAVDDTSTLDVHIYAICFLYRHSFELLLKDLSWKSNYATYGNKEYPQNHGLSNLWQDVQARTRGLLGADFPLTTDAAAEVERLFASIKEHDPKSNSF
jgi:hypothetical protein